ncbi:MAG TPA: hypothetical protein VD713_05275, partial [Sphingomonadales bacterium]|nr:hypothetical protein [Sphingomonadales bacterium]
RCMFLLFSLLFFAGLSPAAGEDFAALSGVPVMEGLSEVPDSLVVFDKEEGRLIEAALAGGVAPEDAAAFYREALFQLGWALDAETPAMLGFSREGERLLIEFEEGRPLTLRFRLGPEN